MKTTVMLLAICISIPASADTPCPFEVEPWVIQGILWNDGRAEFRNSLMILDPVGGSGYNTVAEFDVTDFQGDIQHISLLVEVENLDFGGPAGRILVFLYIGDGLIEPMEYWAGDISNWVYTTMNTQGPELLAFDVTSFVLDALAAGETYVGFRMSSNYDDYYLYDLPRLRCDEGVANEAATWGRIKVLHH